jgi:hypothetical protein
MNEKITFHRQTKYIKRKNDFSSISKKVKMPFERWFYFQIQNIRL